MKNIFLLLVAFVLFGSVASAGECVNGTCSLRQKSVNVAKAVVKTPVKVVRKTTQVVRNVGQKTAHRVRCFVR